MADETINIKVLLDTANSAKSIADTRKSIKDLTSAALQVGEGSDEFQQLTQAAGELKDRVDDTRGAVKFFSDDMRNLSGTISIAKGIAAGFEVAQGAMAMFGAEGENVQKALLKVQSSMAVLNGIMAIQEVLQKTSKASLLITNTLRSIAVAITTQQTRAVAAEAAVTGTATIAQRALNAAMAANPIGLLITLIVAAVAALTLWSNASDKASAEEVKANAEREKAAALLKKQTEEMNRAAETIGKESSSYIGLIEKLRLTNANSKERRDLIKEINDQYGSTLKNLGNEKDFQDQLNLSVEQYILFKEKEYLLKRNDEKIAQSIEGKVKAQQELNAIQKEFNEREAEARAQGASYRGVLPMDLADRFDAANKKIADMNKWQKALGISTQKTTDEIDKLGFKSDEEADNFKKNQKSQTSTQKDESEKRIKIAEEESEKIAAIQSASYLAYEKSLEDLNISLEKGKQKEYETLIYAQQKETQALIEKNLNDIEIIESTGKTRLEKDKEIAVLEKSFRDTLNATELKQYGDLIKFKQSIDKAYIDTKQDINVINAENAITYNEKLRNDELKTNKDLIDSTIDKEAEELRINEKYNKLKIKLVEDLRDAKNTAITQDTELAISELDKEITRAKSILDERIIIVKDYNDAIQTLTQEASTMQAGADKDETNALIEQYKIKKSAAELDVKTENSILIDAVAQRQLIIENGNKAILENNTATTEATIALGEKETVSLKERTDAWTSYYQQLGSEIINLFAQIDANITAGNVSIIEQRKAAALKAFDEEYQAYQDMTDKKTNAEQAKADKEDEFRAKREALDADYEKQKQEVEYEAAVRAWEYSIAQSAISSAGFILKAGEQVGLPGAAAAAILAGIQLATIMSNPPQKYATGGLIKGEGTGTSDSIHTMLSNGESVINAKSTAMFLPMLDMINQAGGGAPLMNGGIKMSTGGVINNVNNNQVDTTRIEQVLEAYLSRPIKTYVTSSDVTNGQRSDNRLKSRTSF